ncbi:MAG: dephospho-CoA kinase [Clostridiales bacterium]|nr:dephospho-CoA kinase [Clostridiales bacterium]
MVIGVTGRIATGKTTVADIFERKGFFRIDADKVYHDLKISSKKMNREIINRFGSLKHSIILANIKNDESALSDLNKITHKYVEKEIEDLVELNKKSNIILDVPVPVKKGFCDLTDFIIVTNCSRNTQINRLMKRVGETNNSTKTKINMQSDEAYYRNIGDLIIETDDLNKQDLRNIIEKEIIY